MLHQLKKAHSTIEDMKHVLEKADAKVITLKVSLRQSQITQYKAELELTRRDHELDRERFQEIFDI